MGQKPTGDLGNEGERFALRLLKREGFRILETNHRGPGGEIDVIALEQGTICFVEVKTRRSEWAGSPEEAVDEKKIRRIVKTARAYSSRHRLESHPARFDVVAVRVGEDGVFHGELTRGAFYEDGWG
jgi:putative endonuclease